MTPEPLEPPPPVEAKHCLNCGAVLTGRYCADCGQTADVHVPSTRELVHEALEGITHSDSRLWRTLHLLWFSPGRLTREFIAGRRASYLPPFRLYLILSIAFFLIASVSSTRVKVVRLGNGASAEDIAPHDCDRLNATQFDATLFGRDWAPRLKHVCGEIARDNGATLVQAALAVAPKAMFIFLPLIAFLHMLMYWRPRHRYAEHLLFFLHVHAFFFSLMTVVVLSANAAEAWPRMSPALGLGSLLPWSLPLYTVIAMRRVFDRSWARTILKAAALFAVYLVVLGVTLGAVFLYAVLQL